MKDVKPYNLLGEIYTLTDHIADEVEADTDADARSVVYQTSGRITAHIMEMLFENEEISKAIVRMALEATLQQMVKDENNPDGETTITVEFGCKGGDSE